MMKDVDYNDDETWNKYLDEMTIYEMTTQLFRFVRHGRSGFREPTGVCGW